MIVERLKVVNSTNEYIKKYLKKRENAVVRADEQTAGAGTKGRSFISQKGGLYLTRLNFYDNLSASDAFSIMVNSAMGVVKTLLAYGINAGIKWPNDVYANGKKICGILIQNTFCGDLVDYSIVGIGLNVNNPIADEIKDIATSMKEILGKEIDIEGVFLTLLMNCSMPSTVQEYKNASIILQKQVTVIEGENTYKDLAVDILPDVRLQLESGKILSAGELNLKVQI